MIASNARCAAKDDVNCAKKVRIKIVYMNWAHLLPTVSFWNGKGRKKVSSTQAIKNES